MPAIDPRYYDEDIDLDIMVESFKFIRKVAQTAPFSEIVQEELLPGPTVQTDEEVYGTLFKYLACIANPIFDPVDYVRTHTTSSWRKYCPQESSSLLF